MAPWQRGGGEVLVETAKVDKITLGGATNPAEIK